MNRGTFRRWIFLFAAAAQAPACPKYDRERYNYGIDADGDCQYTRAEVLIRDSKVPVKFRSGSCSVDSGRWFDPYTRLTFYAAAELEIDHVVPLSEAHQSGAWAWPDGEKEAFANVLDSAYHLMAVSSATNQSKADFDPAQWLPPDSGYHPQYARIWAKIKVQWGLKADAAELAALHRLLPNDPASAFPVLAPEDSCTDLSALFGSKPRRKKAWFHGMGEPLIFGNRIDGRKPKSAK